VKLDLLYRRDNGGYKIVPALYGGIRDNLYTGEMLTKSREQTLVYHWVER
jgi:hypothetical protein